MGQRSFFLPYTCACSSRALERKLLSSILHGVKNKHKSIVNHIPFLSVVSHFCTRYMLGDATQQKKKRSCTFLCVERTNVGLPYLMGIVTIYFCSVHN